MPKLVLLLLISALISCGGSGSSSSNNELSVAEQRQFVWDVMRDYYLYYDRLPNINPADYASAEALLADIVVNPPDRFSFIGNRVAQQNFFQAGTFEGIGYGRRRNDDNTETVIYVFSDSAAGRPCPGSTSNSPCLQRGDIITASDNTGSTVRLNVTRGSTPFTVELPIGLVRINTVLNSNIQIHNGQRVGYLALSSFIQPTVAELDSAFTDFNNNNIDELILDLRYNGGGLVTTAQRLASYIAGTNGTGADVARLVWNDRHQDENLNYPFVTLNNQLNLNRVYVLTLAGTCSASELVINAMNGIGVDAVTVGQTTCGKPVGSVSFNFGSKVLQPTTFSVVNTLGNGGYFDGLSADCFAEDDTDQALGNPTEGMYSNALFHITNGRCQQIATRSEQGVDVPAPPVDDLLKDLR